MRLDEVGLFFWPPDITDSNNRSDRLPTVIPEGLSARGSLCPYMAYKCPGCGNEYESIGRHWSANEYPMLSEEEKDTIIGLLMGDAYINNVRKDYNRIVVTSTSERFLDHLSNDVIPWIFNDPYLHMSAEESAESMNKSGPSETVNKSEYSDAYRVHSPSHPYFADLREWYSNGSKSYPDNLNITANVARYWYIGDGNLATYNKRPFARISTRNEQRTMDTLCEKLPFNATNSDNYINIPTDETSEFLDWIGDPAPGYEYKWDERLKYEDCQ